MSFINYNGKICKQEDVYISPDNRSFRYGDGFFETVKLVDDKIVLQDYHLERLFTSIEVLHFEKPLLFTGKSFINEVIELAARNKHSPARIRCTFFRGDGGLYDSISHKLNYIIQSWQLNEAKYGLNENGLVIDFYRDAVKHADKFSSIKSNNFLAYAMGAIWAKANQLNDCILLNPFGNIVDTTIANIFIVKDGSVTTPPLADGPVNGLMRRHLIKCLKAEGIPVFEASITEEDAFNASEIFLTNAIRGIQWVKQVGKSNYQNQLSSFLHKKFIEPLC